MLTPEERAARVAETVITFKDSERRCRVGVAGSHDLALVTADRAYAASEAAAVRAAVAAAVAAAVREAVAEERETCAALAETYAVYGSSGFRLTPTQGEIARAIRGRPS